MKQYWKALLGLIAMALIYHFIGQYMPASFAWFMTLLWCTILILFGYLMAPGKRRNNRWLGKTILTILILFIVLYKLDFAGTNTLVNLLSLVGLSHEFLNLLLIFSGWAFFQV